MIKKIFLLLTLTSIVYSQQMTITIGTGTNSCGHPFFTMFDDAKGDLLYKAEDIHSAGVASGKITQIGFNVENRSANLHSMAGFTIKMQHTNLDSLTNIIDDGWIEVYSTSNYDIPSKGWQYISLSQPFQWNGNDNILIEICFDNPNGSSLTYNYVYCTIKEYKTASVKWNDRDHGCSFTSSFPYGKSYTEMPNISMTFNPYVPKYYTVTTSSNPIKGGITSSGCTYKNGQSVTVIAMVNEDYIFENWTEEGSIISTTANYTFTVNNNRNLVANFKLLHSNE